MLRNFNYANIEFKKQHDGDGLVICGQITNKSGRNYHSVVFRVTVFTKSIPVGSAVVTINGFMNGQTRLFERQVGELNYSKVISRITNHEIYAESAY
jgi:hypothetical protein